MMQSFVQSLRYALRQLRRAPGFAATIVVTLALGIGANTAIFTLFDQVLLRMLPVQKPQELVRFEWSGSFSGSSNGFGGGKKNYFSYPMYKDLRDRSSAFAGMVAASRTNVGISWHDQAASEDAELVSGNYFDVLGLRPAVGRLLTSFDEGAKNSNPVVVLGYDYWKTHFNAAQDVVGQALLINGHPFTVLGVAPQGFHSAVDGYNPRVFLPVSMVEVAMPWMAPGDDLNSHKSIWLTVFARLRPGVTRQQAEASVGPLWYSLRAEELTAYKNGARFKEGFLNKSHLSVMDDSAGFMPQRAELRMPMLVLMGMVGVLAAMCAVNVATLLLLRAAGRVREFSLRYALGAAKSRIVGQLLVEGGLLGAMGCLAGLALSPVIARALVRLLMHAEEAIDSPYSAAVGGRALLFSLVLSYVVCLAFSVAPALQFLRPKLAEALRQNTGTASKNSQRFRKVAVGLQIALTILLMGGAGLFLRTLTNLRSQNIGLQVSHLMTLDVDPTLAGYDEANRPRVESGVLEAVRSVPGVQQAAGTTDPVIAGDSSHSSFAVQGHLETDEDDTMHFEDAWVTPDYFAALGQPLLAGRDFSPADAKDAPHVAIVNLTFAKRFFGSPQNALGRLMAEGSGNAVKYDLTIIGVVGDAFHHDMRDKVAEGVFRSYAQMPHPVGLQLYVRTAQTPEIVENAIRESIHRYDPKLVAEEIRTMEEQIDRNVSNERALALLAASFSALALLMTAVGLYGVLAFATAQRTREIGVRMALGSDRTAVVMLVLKEMALTAVIAIVAAVPAAIGLSKLVQSQLYGVVPGDPLTLAGCVVIATLMVLASAAIPARRAASVDPMLALRTE
ncbi:ABC transporter permease [Terriglobus saanensis]|uniref:Permease n=1 Tax=Terriglobus saanensis (strain ATCC BAA-1853 / DSM 23119 / SP1PR4) TaxID=401053 RepID=E8V2E2_TERSS|nr:ABC transporter permease [Terriglobus saanensis]ADV81275.1 permease [Terriglobus saanensis SP1PR4]